MDSEGGYVLCVGVQVGKDLYGQTIMCVTLSPYMVVECGQWYSSPVCVVACTHQVIKLLPEPPSRSSGPPALEGEFGRSFEAMDRYRYACVCVCVCVCAMDTCVSMGIYACVCAYVRGRRMQIQMCVCVCVCVFCLCACRGQGHI
jgi:hypothetical protein